ncbi:calcium-binding protein [Leptolyngbya sp. CCNP1308]|uniref:calcium-binding protein n=1 Tax=Leptolyngbya sp. CCNP1308 TaxID=3110255 RepID=UPI002B1F4F0F|nr:calcium-binding protein [Leptolyngbya sp. CCNP1308]MEA5448560.1 calcium-binding protein [Leptolyngbya sp. CCNP1308]
MANLNGSIFSDVVVDTLGNDTIKTFGGDDYIYGGFGNDVISGGSGFDTIDYSFLGQGISLNTGSFVSKGTAGFDSLFSVENIIGAFDQINTIDGSLGDSGLVSLTVDLSINSLTINDIFGLGTLSFVVQNFIDVIGTSQGDTIIGDFQNNVLDGWGGDDYIFGGDGNDQILGFTGNDTLDGSTGSDSLFGEAGNDTLFGGSNNDALFGGSGSDFLAGESGNDVLVGYGFDLSEYDVLSGGSGADVFALGDTANVYYQGYGYATITDFNFLEGDKIQVAGGIGNYSLSAQSFSGGLALDTLIYFGSDLIGVVEDNTNVVPAFDFVTA